MGKWETYQGSEEEWTQIFDGVLAIADCQDEQTAEQICLMHNEGVGLLKQVTKDVVIDHNGRPTTKPSFFAEKAQDLLKRMGVDCE